MSAKAPDIFSLRDAVVGEYRKFAASFTTIHADDVGQQVEAVYTKDRCWPESLVQINPSDQCSTSVDELVAGKVLDPGTADIFLEPLSSATDLDGTLAPGPHPQRSRA